MLSKETIVLLISFAVSLVLGAIIIPILKKLKVGQIEREEGPQSHLKKQGTPTMGGIIMMVSMFITIVISYIYMRYSQLQLDEANKMLVILVITIGFGIVGLVDDFKKLVLKKTEGLKPRYKMLGLLIISVAYVMYLVFGLENSTKLVIPFLEKTLVLPIYLYIPFAILVILGTTNAVNLTDGIDGLSSSVSAIILATLSIIAMKLNIPEISIFAASMVGIVLGFLMYNLHPAKVFMGDTGSLLLGGGISVIALYLKMPLLLLIIALVPVLETLSVIIQVAYYKKTGNRIFKMAPLHHHYELSGWRENKVVIIFSLVTFLLCVVGMASV